MEFLLESLAKSSLRNAGGIRPEAELSPALSEASLYGHGKVVQLLLERGANVNAKDETAEALGETLLISASGLGYSDIVKILLEHGANVNPEASGAKIPRETPLIAASRSGYTDIARLLWKPGADPNAENPAGSIDSETAHGSISLLYACKLHHVDIVKLLLEHGADPNLECPGSSTPLHEAVKSRCLAVVETLLRWPDVKLTHMNLGEDETTPVLRSLLLLWSLDVLRLALARDDLDLNEKDHNGRTVVWWLLCAPFDKHNLNFQVDTLRLIVQHPKCNINEIDAEGRTYVVRFPNQRILNTRLLSLLLQSGADVDRLDEYGETAIFYAVTLRYSLEITSLLIRHEADLAIKNRWGQSLTHRLVDDIEDIRDQKYMDLLLERVPDLINAQDNRGRTPLYLALILGKTELAKELLARAADVNRLDRFGRAPFDVACKYGHSAILSYLAPVGIYKVQANLESHHSMTTAQVKHSAPEFGSSIDSVRKHLDTTPRWKFRREQSVPEVRKESKAKDPNAWVVDPLSVDRMEDLPTYLNQRFRPMALTDDEEVEQEAQARHAASASVLHPGRALFEMQLNRLPAWSLGYLGKRRRTDAISPTDKFRTI